MSTLPVKDGSSIPVKDGSSMPVKDGSSIPVKDGSIPVKDGSSIPQILTQLKTYDKYKNLSNYQIKKEIGKYYDINQARKAELLIELDALSKSIFPSEIIYEILNVSDVETIIKLCSTSNLYNQYCDYRFWVSIAERENIPIKTNVKDWIKDYIENKNFVPKYLVFAEGGGMSSEWFTNLKIINNNKAEILKHYRLFWDDYDQWPEANKGTYKLQTRGKIEENKDRIAIRYKVEDPPIGISHGYEIVNPKHIFSY